MIIYLIKNFNGNAKYQIGTIYKIKFFANKNLLDKKVF